MKKTLLSRAAAISISFVATGTAWSDGTGYAYYPMKPGHSIRYQVFRITNYWHDSAMKLDVISRTKVEPQFNPQTLSFSGSTCQSYFGSGPLYVIYYRHPGVPATQIIWSNTLQDGGWVSSNSLRYIGEAINNRGNVQIPFIAKLTMKPVAGQVIEERSVVTQGCNNKTVIDNKFHWKYSTVEHLVTWGAFTDVWRTGLREYNTQSNPNVKDKVYNYVFMRNVGMVNFWYGTLDPSTNRVVGYEFYAISY